MEPGTYDRGTETSADQLKEKASELTRTAGDRALSTLDEQKSQLSGLLDRVADSMQDDPMGGYAAEYARRGARFLRERPSRELARSIQGELRARPGLALSAAFIAGLAFARLLKGGASDPRDRGDAPSRWAGGDGEWRERGHGELREDYASWRYGEGER